MARCSRPRSTYANVAFSGAVSICMLNLLGSAVRGTGNMALPAAVIVGSVIAHVLDLAVADLRLGAVAGPRARRCRLGPDGCRSAPAAWCCSPTCARAASLVTLTFRGATLRWALFAEILKVGVPGLINVMITNLSVVLLTGIAGHLGQGGRDRLRDGRAARIHPDPAGVRVRHAIVAMVGTNWGARQYRRAREIAWTGAGTVGGRMRVDRIVVAIFPTLWMGLFTER